VPSKQRVLPPDRDGPRFRLVRLWRVGDVIKAEAIGTAETPAECLQRVFSEEGRVLAVDRRGDAYADNHKPIQERA
jgi:hypothetical protein